MTGPPRRATSTEGPLTSAYGAHVPRTWWVADPMPAPREVHRRRGVGDGAEPGRLLQIGVAANEGGHVRTQAVNVHAGDGICF